MPIARTAWKTPKLQAGAWLPALAHALRHHQRRWYTQRGKLRASQVDGNKQGCGSAPSDPSLAFFKI
eukprot:11174059-Lingulodinium_polyedra.AAC.1